MKLYIMQKCWHNVEKKNLKVKFGVNLFGFALKSVLLYKCYEFFMW